MADSKDLPIVEGVWAIHAVLLHTGELLLFSGRLESEQFRYEAWIWNPGATDFPPAVDAEDPTDAQVEAYREAIPAPFNNTSPEEPDAWWTADGKVSDDYENGLDLFCCHHVHLDDGRILVMGGAGGQAPGDANGNPAVYIFDRGMKPSGTNEPPPDDPELDYWSRVPIDGQMDDGRWYPTSVVLPDGRVVAFSGRRIKGAWINDDVEVFSPPHYEAEIVLGGERKLHTYPSMHLVRGGRVFYTNATWAYRDEQELRFIKDPLLLDGSGLPTAAFRMTGLDRGEWEDFPHPANPALKLRPTYVERKEAAAVLLPPAGDGRILLVGGSRSKSKQDTDSAGNLLYLYNPTPEEPEVELAADAELNVIGGDEGALTASTELNMRWVYKDKDGNLVSESVRRKMIYDGITPESVPDAVEILHTRGLPGSASTDPVWEDVSGMHHGRVNPNLVILPTGKVLIVGGETDYKGQGHGFVKTCELFDPQAESPAERFREMAPLSLGREYHSTALLLPDGRVWVGSGDANEIPSSGHNMELYKPPYFFIEPSSPRLVIHALQTPTTGEAHVDYGGTFFIEVSDLSAVTEVVLMKPGAATHQTDSEQRLVKPSFFRKSLGENGAPDLLEVGAPLDASVAPPGHYMVWVIDNLGRPCVEAKFLRLTHRRCELFTNRSSFGKDEIGTLIDAGQPAVIEKALYVHVSGFLPGEIGIDGSLPQGDDIHELEDLGIGLGPGSSGMVLEPRRVIAEDTGLDPGRPQLLIFEYALRFDDLSAFPDADSGPDAPDSKEIQVEFEVAGRTCEGKLRLLDQPNPFMEDGETPWLSVDLRIFKVRDSETKFGETVDGDPNAFILKVLENLDEPAHDFESLPTEQDHEDSLLALSPREGGELVWNFAIAKVHYRGSTDNNADGVRCFFRAFQTAATNLEFNRNFAYRAHPLPPDQPQETPLLGLGPGNHVVSIPFFAHPRAGDMSAQQQDVRELLGSDDESFHYFGCWLDINQDEDRRFPEQLLDPNDHGPYTASAGNPLLSIQELVTRGRHQCLVAELVFEQQVKTGDTPGTSDKLAQRNIAYADSNNPGTVSSRTVQHTFDLDLVADGATVRNALAVLSGTAGQFSGKHTPVLAYDALQISWGSLPRDTEVEIYMPNADIETMVELYRLRYGPTPIEQRGPDTLALLVEGATRLPVVSTQPINVAGLITLRLPPGVTAGDRHTVVMQQLDGIARRVVGSFQFTVVVSHAEQIVERVANDYAVMKHVEGTIKPTDRWYPVFKAYMQGVAERVRGLGAVPELIPASSAGWRFEPPDLQCQRAGLGVSAMIALGLVMLGLGLGPAGGSVLLGAFVLLLLWLRGCRPEPCEVVRRLLHGAGAAAGGLAVFALAGYASNTVPRVLAFCALMVAVLLLIAQRLRCCLGEQDPMVFRPPAEERQPELRSEREERLRQEREKRLAAKRAAVDALPNLIGRPDVVDEHFHAPGPRPEARRDGRHRPHGPGHG